MHSALRSVSDRRTEQQSRTNRALCSVRRPTTEQQSDTFPMYVETHISRQDDLKSSCVQLMFHTHRPEGQSLPYSRQRGGGEGGDSEGGQRPWQPYPVQGRRSIENFTKSHAASAARACGGRRARTARPHEKSPPSECNFAHGPGAG
jgi:hypothetical protein